MGKGAVTLRDRTQPLFFPLFVPQPLPTPLTFPVAIEEKRGSENFLPCLSFRAVTRLPRDLITFLNEAGLSSLIKMIGPYYMLSQFKGHKSLMALEFCQISFDIHDFFSSPLVSIQSE